MEDKLYIIFAKRRQRMPEIFASYTDYDTAIIEYYRLTKTDYEESNSWNSSYWKFNDNRNGTNFFWKLMELPINCSFADYNKSSDVQFGAGSKYMVKFKNYGELIDKHTKLSRNKKIKHLLNGTH